MNVTADACVGSCTEVAERAWVQLIRAHRGALCSVEKALRAAELPSLEWYDVLLELERAGPLRSRDRRIASCSLNTTFRAWSTVWKPRGWSSALGVPTTAVASG